MPGAVFLDADRELSSPGDGPGRHPIPSPAKLAGVLGHAGIGDGSPVVAYDDAGGSIAARLWWLYRHFGHDGDCAVLDGGIQAWTDAGLPLSTRSRGIPSGQLDASDRGDRHGGRHGGCHHARRSGRADGRARSRALPG